MLLLTIHLEESWDAKNEVFVYPKSQTISLEHSLISLSKWESKWCKPFLTKEEKTVEETIDYIKCMTLTPNVGDDIYDRLSPSNIREINKYIDAPMTATWFSEKSKKGHINREQVTSELIYYWMITLNIPFECQKWHLNRLLTLIRVCNIKNDQSPKKMSQGELLRRNDALNKARRKKFNTKG